MWNNIKKIAWIIFDRYIHYIVAFLYLSVVSLEYYVGSFNLSQFITYTAVPTACFYIFYINGYKKAERYVRDVSKFHDLFDMMHHLVQNQKIESVKDKPSIQEGIH